MYTRTISFTLLAPSIWSIVEALASNVENDKLKRYLFKSTENAGFIIEIFSNKADAGLNIDTLKAMQSLKEQTMAKVTVQEGIFLE